MPNTKLPVDRPTRWIFLSPHLDDAVFSCGGLISYLTESETPVEIWTIFSDQDNEVSRLSEYARSLHSRWGAGDYPYLIRKEEDHSACKMVGATPVHFGFLDCIYRVLPASGKAVVVSDKDLVNSEITAEQPLIRQVSDELMKRISDTAMWVCPLSLGGHIDHRITRMAAEATHKLMLYYADLPYAIARPVQSFNGMIRLSLHLPEENVQKWGKANLQYASQISSFWKDGVEMASRYSDYLDRYNGMPLWLPNPVESGGK